TPSKVALTIYLDRKGNKQGHFPKVNTVISPNTQAHFFHPYKPFSLQQQPLSPLVESREAVFFLLTHLQSSPLQIPLRLISLSSSKSQNQQKIYCSEGEA
ncbi:hypothetical protein AKJ16_DCAP02451, partial [Drosera capensis]